MGEKGLAAAQSLLVHLSPATGEPVALHSNNRVTQMKSILATSTISAANSDVKQEINFANSLLNDDPDNPIGTSGSNPLHFFISAAHQREVINFEKKQIGDYKDDLMQSWMELNYREKAYPFKEHSKLQLFIANQGVRDVTVEDINHLHLVLNIPKFFNQTAVFSDDSHIPVVSFKHIFEKLNQITLYNAHELHKFITGEDGLGIPLNNLDENGFPPPIHEQWKYLSYFLQFCSPICLSPMEGGHRTLQLIKFFTGAKFTEDCPQPFAAVMRNPGDKIVKPHLHLNEHGIALTKYECFFGSAASKIIPWIGL